MNKILKFVKYINSFGVDKYFAMNIDRRNNYPNDLITELTKETDDPVEKRQLYLNKFKNGCEKILRWNAIYIKRLERFKIKRLYLNSN